MSTVAEAYGTGGDYCRATTFLASLECELESVRQAGLGGIAYFQAKKDGSLRNHGYEFVSTIAQSREHLVESFRGLHRQLSFYEKDDPFSHRTSTHVHVNVSSLDLHQVKNMLLLYALFEEFFFSLVKPARRDNIHCVPLTDTYLPKDYKRHLEWLVDHWSKYTAFNLAPVKNFGSVEFRHLHGTGDAEEVDRWLHVLENLWKLCRKVEINEKTISDKDLRQEWFDLLFFPAPTIMALRNSMPNIIKNSLIDVKFSALK